MDKVDMINDMLESHSLYRKSYIDDLESKENKYKILKLLMKRAINDSVGTYNIEKEVIKLQKIIEMNISFESKRADDCTDRLREIWKHSLLVLLDYKKSVLDINEYVNFNLQQYMNILHIGNVADINRDKLEFDILKINYMNKKRR